MTASVRRAAPHSMNAEPRTLWASEARVASPLPIRLVHVTGGTRAGSTRVVLNQLAHHDRQRFSPAVCFFSIARVDPSIAEEVDALGVAWREVVKQSRYEFGALDRLSLTLRELAPDLVVLHGFGAYGYGALAARLAGARVVVRVEHSPELHSPLHALLSACSASWVDSFVLVSAYVGRYLEQHGTTLVSPEVIYNGVDLAPFVRVQREPFSGSPPWTVLMTARLDVAKDHETLLDAAAILRRQGVPIRLRLAGDGPLRERLAARGRAGGIEEAVEFLGHRTDLPALLEDADVFVLATHYEGFGLAIVEAMAAGRPVVATNTTAIPELVEPGRTGLLVEGRNPEALATAIARLIADRERARAMGALGRVQAQRFARGPAMAAFDEHLERIWRASQPRLSAAGHKV